MLNADDDDDDERKTQTKESLRNWITMLFSWETISRDDSSLRNLCYQGIPAAVRGKAWSLLIENPLQINQELYLIFKNRADKLAALEADFESTSQDKGEINDLCTMYQGLEATMVSIEQDLPRTFAEQSAGKVFHSSGPLSSSLGSLLRTFSCYRPDLGYVQGMSYMAAMCVYYADEYTAFQTFANMICKRITFDFYRLKPDIIAGYVSTFDHFFESHIPTLYSHFQEEGVSSQIFLMDWSMTVFSKALPMNTTARLWDAYLIDGEVFVIRCAIAILKMFEAILEVCHASEIIRYLAKLPPGIDTEKLIEHVSCINIDEKEYIAVKQAFEPKDRLIVQSDGGKGGNGKQHKSQNSVTTLLRPSHSTSALPSSEVFPSPVRNQRSSSHQISSQQKATPPLSPSSSSSSDRKMFTRCSRSSSAPVLYDNDNVAYRRPSTSGKALKYEDI